MALWPGPEGNPVDSSSLQSSVVRDRLDALYWMDLKVLRAEAESTPSMRVYVHPSYGKGVRQDEQSSFFWPGGYTSTLSAPTVNPRYDLIYITPSGTGTLGVVTGAESASPVVPEIPDETIPLAILYMRVGMTSIKDVDDSTNGYVFYRVQPYLNLGGAVTVKDRVTSDVTIGNTATETDIYSKSITAGLLGTNKLLSLIIAVKSLTSDAGSQPMTLRARYGGTLIGAITLSVADLAAATGVIRLDLFGDGTTTSQIAVFECNIVGDGSNTFQNCVVTQASVNSAAVQTLNVTIEMPASVSNVIVVGHAHLRKE